MKTPVDRARVFRVFLEALDVDPESRDWFLGQQCQGNEAIRAEVEELLQVAMRDEARTGAFLAPAPDLEADLSGSDFGRFRLVEVSSKSVAWRLWEPCSHCRCNSHAIRAAA